MCVFLIKWRLSTMIIGWKSRIDDFNIKTKTKVSNGAQKPPTKRIYL